jgi:hypothetical protein
MTGGRACFLAVLAKASRLIHHLDICLRKSRDKSRKFSSGLKTCAARRFFINKPEQKLGLSCINVNYADSFR